jgi:hypothetical protein
VSDPLTQLAIRVLDAQAVRRRVAEFRCCVNADDETACLDADDLCEAARANLEAAYRVFFQAWIDEQISEQTESDMAAEGLRPQ